MFEMCNFLVKKIERLIKKAECLESYDEQRLSKILSKAQDLFDQLDVVLQENSFNDVKMEIKFFKKVLPRVLYKYWMLYECYTLYHLKPLCTSELEQFYRAKINDLIDFKETHFNLHCYFVAQVNNRDTIYFTYSSLSNFRCLDKDHNSYVFSYFKVIEEMICLLQSRLMTITEVSESIPKLNWTTTSTSLAILIYALKDVGCVNNGNATIKELCIAFEQIFNISLQKQVHSLLHEYQKTNNKTNNILLHMINVFGERIEEKL